MSDDGVQGLAGSRRMLTPLQKWLLLAVAGLLLEMAWRQLYPVLRVATKSLAMARSFFSLANLLTVFVGAVFPITMVAFLMFLYWELSHRARVESRKTAAWAAAGGRMLYLLYFVIVFSSSQLRMPAAAASRVDIPGMRENLVLWTVVPGAVWLVFLLRFATKNDPLDDDLVHSLAAILAAIEVAAALRMCYSAFRSASQLASQLGWGKVMGAYLPGAAIPLFASASLVVVLCLIWRMPRTESPGAEA